MRHYPNPFKPTTRHSATCPVCGDPAGNFTFCCQSCAEEAFYTTSCGNECDCESLAAHEAAQDEAEKDFLRNPGSPPAHMDEDAVDRARESMAERRVALGMK